jgi:hypothetical protein
MPGACIGQSVRVPLVASVGGDTHTPDLSGAPVWTTFAVVGIVTAQGVARLDRRLSAVDKNFFTQPPTTPTDLVNFGRFQNLPLILASALAVLSLAVVMLAVSSWSWRPPRWG